MEALLQAALIPLLMSGGLIYYAVRILVFHDTSVLRRQGEMRRRKDEDAYTKTAAYLMIFLACVSALMIPLIYVDPRIALGEVIVGLIIFGILWKRMDNKYGYK